MGIDIEIHSATKFYAGHSDLVAGYVLCSAAMASKIFASEYLNIGAIISPSDAWLLIRSLRTLPLRMQQIGNTTLQIVSWLEQHAQVEKVIFPFSESFPQYQLAKEQMTWGGGLFSIQLKVNTIDQVETFCNSLQCFLMAVSWGGHESLIIPACAFGSQSEMPVNFVRFYIGLEETDILLKDLAQAMVHL